ncbi:hypothetical protein E2C01_050122 [Portunus trituberculatus]|uniref:Uncharacterized protein n=1 Tax=Portunus trituberculatus TaxID=210409 RepID=A0A5B7GF78_PORTR|nr:hypothetical protein [Portunus trituberculatus]
MWKMGYFGVFQRFMQNTLFAYGSDICQKGVILVYSSVFCNKTHNCRQNTLFV